MVRSNQFKWTLPFTPYLLCCTVLDKIIIIILTSAELAKTFPVIIHGDWFGLSADVGVVLLALSFRVRSVTSKISFGRKWFSLKNVRDKGLVRNFRTALLMFISG